MSRFLFDHPGSNGRRPRRSTPSLESLEYRTMLATFSPLASAADGSPRSLRAAIIQAESNGQDNTINLQAGTYQLSIPNLTVHQNDASRGGLDLTGAGYEITIEGAGAGVTIIDGGQLDRVFEVLPGVTAVFRDLTIQRGLARDDGTAGAVIGAGIAVGGGVLNEGSLELDSVIVQDCAASAAPGTAGVAGGLEAGGYGAAAFGGGIANEGTLTLFECVVRNNSAEGGAGGAGALGADTPASGGEGGNGVGGGMDNYGSLTVTQSTEIEENIADGGTGGAGGQSLLGNGGNAGNGSAGLGGGIRVAANATEARIINSTIALNSAVGGGGGTGGAGSTLGNFGADGGNGGSGQGGLGGGMEVDAPVSIFNSTIAANQAIGGSAAIGGAGGAGFPQRGTDGLPGRGATGYGGGIDVNGSVGAELYLNAVSTIIAENSVNVGSAADVDGIFASADHTLVGVADGASGISNGADGNILGVYPQLGPLQNNGGPTPTMAVLAGSPAIAAGSNPLGLASDQRGYTPRAAGGGVDVGAFQLGAQAPTPGQGEGASATQLTVKILRTKGRREVVVFDAATGALRFAVYPFGKSYRGTFQVHERDVNGDGVPDVIVQRPRGHRKFVTAIFSGVDGSPLPANLV